MQSILANGRGDSVTDFGSRLVQNVAAIPDIRRQVNCLNSFSNELQKTSPDSASRLLNDSRLATVLIKTFAGCSDLHQTVKDIIRHVLNVFISKGPEEFKSDVRSQVRLLIASESRSRLRILRDLIASRTIAVEIFFAPDTFPDIMRYVMNMMKRLNECAPGEWPTVAEEIGKVSETLHEMSFIQNLVELAPPIADQDDTQLLISSICEALMSFHSTASDRHPELFSATSSLLRTIFVVYPASNKLVPIEKFDASQTGYSAVLSAHLCAGTFDRGIGRQDAIFTDVQMALKNHPVCGVLAVLTFCQQLRKEITLIPAVMKEQSCATSESDFTKSSLSRLVRLWTALQGHCNWTSEVNHILLTKSVEVLILIVPMWAQLAESDRSHIISSVETLPCFSWTTAHGQRSWVEILRVCPASFSAAPRICDILETLSVNQYGPPLVDLIVAVSTPSSLAEILLKSSTHWKYLMKHILPGLVKRPGFMMEVMALLKERLAYLGYGQLFYSFRAVKVPNAAALRIEIFRNFIKGKRTLAVIDNDLARVEIFGFFCETAAPMEDFDQFVDFVSENMNHQFSKFREPFLQSLSRFLRRLEDTCFSSTVAQLPSQESMVQLMRKLFAFFTNVVHQCIPSSSYARRNMALNILHLLLNGPLAMTVNSPHVWDPIERSLMEQLFWESFPDNQAIVVDILCLHSDKTKNAVGDFSRDSLAKLARTRARSCVSNDCKIASSLDLVARGGVVPAFQISQEILRELQMDIAAAQTNGMIWAARNSPLYGQILRLRKSLAALSDGVASDFVMDCLGIRVAISDLVSEALVFHSGGLSMDKDVVLQATANGDSDDETLGTTAQMLFVCCWRCIREVALLLGDVCCEKACGKLVPESIKAEIVEWMISQLLITSHIGAFDGLAEQISRICRIFMDSDSPTGLDIVKKILQNLLGELTSWTSPLKPENTRKSAGLPRLLSLLFVVLKKTDPGQDLLQTSMEFLLSEAAGTGDPMVDSRVRAINIVEAIFKQNALCEQTETFVATAFCVSCDCMASEYWPVRNAAASLLTTLMQRVFGPGVKQCPEDMEWRENCLPAARFFAKYPALFDYAIEVLQAGKTTMGYEASNLEASRLHCVLLVLQRLYSDVGDPAFLHGLAGSLRLCVGHPDMRVRQAAARAFSLSSCPTGIDQLLEDAPQIIIREEDHLCYGVLLTLLNATDSSGLLEKSDSQAISSLVRSLVSSLNSHNTSRSPQTQTLMLRIFQRIASSTKNSSIIEEIHHCIVSIHFDGEKLTEQPGQSTWLLEYSRVLLQPLSLPGTLFNRDYVPAIISRMKELLGTSNEFPVLLKSCFDVLAESCSFLAKLIELDSELLEVFFNFGERRDDGVESSRMAVIDGLIRNSSVIPRELMWKAWNFAMDVLKTPGHVEIISQAIQLASRIVQNITERTDDMNSTYTTVMGKILSESCPLDLRICLAGNIIPPDSFENFTSLWFIFIDLLRDDDQLVRLTAAKRLQETDPDSRPPVTPSCALSYCVDSLVKIVYRRGTVVDLLFAILDNYVDVDDRIGAKSCQSEDADVTVFECSDCHEYHENLWLVDGVCQNVKEMATASSHPPAHQTASHDQCRRLVKAIQDSIQFIRDTPFLSDIAAVNQTAFRLYCLIAVLGALRDCGSWPEDGTEDLSKKLELLHQDRIVRSCLLQSAKSMAAVQLSGKGHRRNCQHRV